MAAEGKNVYKLTLTNNITHSEHLNIDVEYKKSRDESASACAILGVHEIKDFAPEECNHLSYGTDLMQRVEDVIYKYDIDTVFSHYEDDLNRDHTAAAKICLTAARHCDNIFLYQSNLYILPCPFNPTYFMDISDYIELKKAALAKYTGDHNRFNALFETNIERNSVWGYSNKTKYAEGFVVQKFLYR